MSVIVCQCPLMSTTKYLTVQEAAALYRVSERTIRRWIGARAVRHIRIGGVVRVVVSDPPEKVAS